MALGVLIGLLVALFVTGYLSFRAVAKGVDFGSGVPIREWVQGLEEKAQDWLNRRMGTKTGEGAGKHLVRGYGLYKKKRYAGALEEFTKAVRADGTNPEAYYWRGRTLIGQGRFEPAVEDFQRAAELKPDYAEAYDNLGWLHDRLGATDKAIEAFSKSIALRPENGWAFFQRGRMLFKKGDREGALRDAGKACDLGFEEGCGAYKKWGGS